ncbi:hypothetical protein [Halapricum salinum]|uniref:Uncharacterized protein n=1 Tax=Halapricum salinum TaxID=1457250 RepID=A0A4D6H8W4_9EURY|nr:hypothetical protein [Halapricum salinum]QCC50514.1 hypothetical protein DV733_04335 [Halapricum salinum]
MTPSTGPETDDATDSSDSKQLTTRRKLMATGAATWATVGLAGCTGNDGGNGNGNGDTTEPSGNGNGNGDTTTEPTPTPTPSPQPENYIVSTNTYWNGHPAPEGTGGYVGTCSPERQFRRDMDVTFVIGVWDPDTGDPVTDDVVDSATVSFPDRPFDDVELEFVPAEEEGDKPQWNGTFDIPDDAESGSVAYELQVSDGDANFYEVGIASAGFTIIDPEPTGATNYVVTTETFWNGHPAPDGTNGFVGACSPERQFRASDMDVTFVIGLYNGSSGEFVGASAVDSVMVTFPDSDQFDAVELSYQEPAENTEEQWNGTLALTEMDSVPPGTYTYEVDVQGADGNVTDLGVASDSFTVIEE